MARPNTDEDSVGAVILQVAEDAKAYAAAQIALYRAIATVRMRAARSGLIFGAIAGTLALAALIALLVGLILALSPIVGPLGATAIVVVATLVIAGLLGWLAAGHIGRAVGDIE